MSPYSVMPYSVSVAQCVPRKPLPLLMQSSRAFISSGFSHGLPVVKKKTASKGLSVSALMRPHCSRVTGSLVACWKR